MAQKTNEVILSMDDKELSANELKRKKKLLKKQEETAQEKTSKEETAQEETLVEENLIEEATEEEETLVEETAQEEELINEDLINETKKQRVGIDKVMTILSSQYEEEHEIIKSLFLAKSWLGSILGLLNSENPYRNEKKIKNRNDIPATADKYIIENYQSEIFQFRLKDKLFQIIEMRDNLKSLIDDLETLDFNAENVTDLRLARIAKTNSYSELCKAKFFLGLELSKLKTN